MYPALPQQPAHRRCHAGPGAPRAGFSLVEILLVIVIMLTLVALLLSVIGQARNAASGTSCLVNLRSISQSFAFYTVDNVGCYPNPAASGQSWEQSISLYLPPTGGSGASFFKCPADQEVFPSLGSSYDWRDTGDPTTTLAGQSVAHVSRENAILAFDALPGWHAPQLINVTLMTGSSYAVRAEEWLKDLSSPVCGP